MKNFYYYYCLLIFFIIITKKVFHNILKFLLINILNSYKLIKYSNINLYEK